MNHRRLILTALAVLLTTAAFGAARAHAQQREDLETLLVGKWYQQSGSYVVETVLNANGEFTAVGYQPGTPYRQYVVGRWWLQNGQLWTEWEQWEPHSIEKPLPEGTPVYFIDRNHFRNKFGLVTRM